MGKHSRLSDRLLKAFEFVPKCVTLLDVGCGSGELSNEYLKKSKQVYGVDSSKKSIEVAKRKYPTIKFRLAPAERLPFEDNFVDVVVMTDVLEHVKDERKTLEEVYRVMKPKGTLILSAPHKGMFRWMDPFNLKFLSPKLYRLWKGKQYDVTIFKKESWHRHYSLKEIRKLFEGKFEITKVHRGGLLIWPLLWLIRDVFISKFTKGPSKLWNKLDGFLSSLDYERDYGERGYHMLIRAKKITARDKF